MIQAWFARSAASAVLCLASLGCSGGDPDDGTADTGGLEDRLLRAEQLLTFGKVEPAAQLAAAITTDAPDDWRGHDLLARIHMQRAFDFEDAGLIDHSAAHLQLAVASYATAIEHGQARAGLWRSGGDAAQLAGDLPLALDWYTAALDAAPDDVRVLLRIAQLRFDAEPEESRGLLLRATEIDPLIPEAHASLALLAAHEGRQDAARARMAEALRLDGENPQLRIVQARVHRVLGAFAVGVEILSALPDRVRASRAATEELALCWEALGRYDRVADAWAACFAANAHRSDAWSMALQAGRAAVAAGDLPRAAALFAQAEMQSAPKDEIEAARAEAAKHEPRGDAP
jgi:hypothetical protein